VTERRWRNWAVALVALATIALLAVVYSCASDPPTTVDQVQQRAADAASGGWFSRMIEAISGKMVEIAIAVTASVVTALAIGVAAIDAIYIGLATLGASFAFRPEQNVTNIDTHGGDYDGGGDGMGFWGWSGVALWVILLVKYGLPWFRSSRNFWGGLWALIAKPGRRAEGVRRMVSATGVAHTSAASKVAARQADDEAKIVRSRLGRSFRLRHVEHVPRKQ